MYVQGYLQGSENGRVVTIALSSVNVSIHAVVKHSLSASSLYFSGVTSLYKSGSHGVSETLYNNYWITPHLF
jgi:hypothetical protein